MVFEIFHRKRSPEPSSSEPPKKFQNRGSRIANASWTHANTSRRSTNLDYRQERNSTRTDYERRPSSADMRTNPLALSQLPPGVDEEDLEPPGTGSSTLQYTLTSRVSFLTWKDRMYRELEELNCLFTIEPTLKRKANMTAEEELTYRNLAKAVICMRLDNAHLALVDKLADPLKVMKVLADYREPEQQHLEKKAQLRLDSTVYHPTVPVYDFIRTFEGLLNEVEKYSGERLTDQTKKQHLLSAVVGEFPNILVGSKTPSHEIRYEDLKKLLVEAVERRPAAKKAEEQRRVANRNVSANQNVQISEKQPAAKSVEVKGQCPASRTGKVVEQRPANANAVPLQGLESRNATSKTADNERTADSDVANNAAAKEQHTVVEDPRPTVQNSDANQRPAAGTNVAGKSAPTSSLADERPLPVANAKSKEQTCVKNSVVDERPLPDKDAKPISRPSATKSDIDERPVAPRDARVIDRRSVAKPDVDERPLPPRDARAIDRRSVARSDLDERPSARDSRVIDHRPLARSDVDERPLPPRDVRANERRPVSSSLGSRNEVADPRPIHTSAKVVEHHVSIENSEPNHWNTSSAAVSRKSTDADERYATPRTSSARYIADTVSQSSALYERRPAKPNVSKDELEEQLEVDRQIQEKINANPHLFVNQTSCTKCGAFGHTLIDCKRKDSLRKCYSCHSFVDDHVASTCPKLGENSGCRLVQPRTFHDSKSSRLSLPPSPPPFLNSRFLADNCIRPEILEDEDEDDDIPLVDGLRQVYHIRRKMTTKKMKTGRVVRKDLIFTDSDFYTDVEYREMFIEEDEEEPGDIILETIKVMTTNQK